MLPRPILRGEYNILIKMAVRRKHVKLAELLAKNVIKKRHQKLDRSSNTLLHDAVRSGQLKVVRILVERGADVNASIRHGLTPLHVATEHGYLKIMDFLIRNGAHVNARCKDGYTPLYFTCESANLKCARLLLKHNASVIPTNVNDTHPIDITVYRLSLKMTQLLLNYGANMAVNKRIRTLWIPRTALYADENLTLLHHIVDVMAESAIFKESRIHGFPEIANDTEYITKRKLECKELAYDLIAEKYSRHLIGLPLADDLSYADLTKIPTGLEVTKEEHEERIKKIKNNIQGVVDEMKREKIGLSNEFDITGVEV
ncbi:ankyrin-3-like [Microplitis mediator]|uniref:ankyrin-3-like n=1 Tax=Microplitis mediator TaxID=375433 RepID=UPI0025523F64|nr:ankyrin-3-like [Microplitis mediator]